MTAQLERDLSDLCKAHGISKTELASQIMRKTHEATISSLRDKADRWHIEFHRRLRAGITLDGYRDIAS